MDVLTGFYREVLSARIDALETAKRTLQKQPREAAEAIQRIAHSLRGSGTTYGFPQISTAAALLERAKPEEIPERLEELRRILREVLAGITTEKVGILIIDDDPEVCTLLEHTLAAENRELFVAGTTAQAEEILAQKRISLIILDLVLPDMDGRTLLLRLRDRPSMIMLPIIVLSAKVGTQTKTECFALGADDYFEKPFDPDTLSAAVTAKLQRLGEISRESRQDPLTGLLNRTAFQESFERAQALANRLKYILSLAILDLDGFKWVNDSYGHALGDEVLRRLGKVVSRSIRKSDFVARWGGDEFVILFSNTTGLGASGALEKLLHACRREPFQADDGRQFRVTFSAGVADIAPGALLAECMADADRLLYAAKAAGGNRVLSAEHKVRAPQKTVLLAEDDEPTAFVVRYLLGRAGFEVRHFADGDAALAAAPDSGASLAILDVRMPKMNGFELLTHLRNIPSFFQTPIVVLTAMGSEEDIVKGFELGADDYIVKPFSPLELLARVRRLLKKR